MAHRKNRSRGDSIMTHARNTIAAYDFLCRQEEVKVWLEDIFTIKINDLVTALKDGVGNRIIIIFRHYYVRHLM